MGYYCYGDQNARAFADCLTLPDRKKKRMSTRTKQQKRKERTQQLNIELSIKPAFTPLYDYKIVHIHHATSTQLLHNLIYLARKTHTFTIDTETDYQSHLPALIQIEFVDSNQSVILLIETCHLPNQSSVHFWLIRSLLKIIFKPNNTILSWGNAAKELNEFVLYQIIDLNTIHQLHYIDIQYCFRHWYNKTFIHTCGVQYSANHLTCTCSFRPYKNHYDKWSLQQAIAYTFDEFLNKRCTINNWIQGLDDRLHPNYLSSRHRQKLIQYAANDCLAVTKLSMAIINNWTWKQIEQFKATSVAPN